MSAEIDRYEVIVIGGGMVGAAAACALARGGIKTALIDRHNPERRWPGEPADIRVSALTKASENILTLLDAWPGILQRGACAYKDMRVWDAGAGGELHFDCSDSEYAELGHIVENRVTVATLWDELESLPTAAIMTSAAVAEMQLLPKGRRIILADGRSFDAELVIAADGRDSSLRSMAGISVTGWAYQQDALVATVKTEQPHQATAWQRFLAEGPLAFLPLHTGECSIVWTLATATASEYLALSDADFLEKLERASNGILGKMLKVGQRAAFPLKFQYADQYTGQSFALIGDAAHAMHPLAGQGANAGFLDAAALAEAVIKTKREGRPISGLQYLRRYERERKGDNLLMMTSMDVINKTYRVPSQVFAKLRSAGMNWVNRNDSVKAYLNHYAMGLRNDLPLLAKGKVCW